MYETVHPPTALSNGGLTAAEVASRTAAGEVNRIPRDDARMYFEIVRRNTLTLFNALVVPAAIALFVLGDYRGAWAVSAVAGANVLLGLIHEIRAKRHLDRLSLLSEARVRVKRDGREDAIPSGDVVRGDWLLLRRGDMVVADGTVLQSAYLEIDEALLTGESDAVGKREGEPVLSGSICVGGEGIYRADRVGVESFAHKTTLAARAHHADAGPTQRALNRIVGVLTIVAVGLCLSYLLLTLVRPIGSTELVQMIAATITSMVPQGLVLLTTLVLVLSAVRLSRQGALVQRLSAIEGLAAVDILCSDKTGTLTTGRQTLDRLVDLSDGDGKGKLGLFARYSIDQENANITALRTALPESGESALTVLDQIPFKSQNRFSAIRVRFENREQTWLLGSVEVIAARCSAENRQRLQTIWHELLPTGLRLIGFAETVDGLPDGMLRPLVLVALRDEFRPNAAEVIADLAKRGIVLKVVSGDHPETVRATVHSAGALFGTSDTVLTGDEWQASADRTELAERNHVFGRVSPEQKLALVETLKSRGHTVGMIGDGVNDLLPIKRADFGVAMGSGSPATKAVAGLVMESNDFAILSKVFQEGQTVVQNVRRAAKLFLLKNVYTVALIIVALGFAGLPFPYLPQQVTLLNALTIGGPSLLILAGRGRTGRGMGKNLLAAIGRFVLVAGASTSALGVAVYLRFGLDEACSHELARSALLVALILAGLGHAIIITHGDRWLFGWAFLAILALMVVFLVPVIRDFFVLSLLSGGQLGMIVAGAAMSLLPALFLTVLDSRASALTLADRPR